MVKKLLWYVLLAAPLALAVGWMAGPVAGWLLALVAFVVLFIMLVTDEPVHLTSLAAPNDPNASTIRGTPYRYVPGVGLTHYTVATYEAPPSRLDCES